MYSGGSEGFISPGPPAVEECPQRPWKKKKDDVIVCAGLVVVLHFASVRCFVDVFYHYLRIIYCCICRLQHSDDKRCSWWRGGGKSRGLDSSAAGIITHISYDTYNSKFNKPVCSNDDWRTGASERIEARSRGVPIFRCTATAATAATTTTAQGLLVACDIYYFDHRLSSLLGSLSSICCRRMTSVWLSTRRAINYEERIVWLSRSALQQHSKTF